jgi:hypothetical protein
MTIREVAARIKQSVGTIYRWVDDDLVEGINVGNLRYVKVRSLIAYLGEEPSRIFGLLPPVPAAPPPPAK